MPAGLANLVFCVDGDAHVPAGPPHGDKHVPSIDCKCEDPEEDAGLEEEGEELPRDIEHPRAGPVPRDESDAFTDEPCASLCLRPGSLAVRAGAQRVRVPGPVASSRPPRSLGEPVLVHFLAGRRPRPVAAVASCAAAATAVAPAAVCAAAVAVRQREVRGRSLVASEPDPRHGRRAGLGWLGLYVDVQQLV